MTDTAFPVLNFAHFQETTCLKVKRVGLCLYPPKKMTRIYVFIYIQCTKIYL